MLMCILRGFTALTNGSRPVVASFTPFANAQNVLLKWTTQGRHRWKGPQGLVLVWILQNRKHQRQQRHDSDLSATREFFGKTFLAAKLTHERFLTIDHSCKIIFWYLPNWTSTDLWCVVFHFGWHLQKWVPSLSIEHFLFRWIVLIGQIWHPFLEMSANVKTFWD